MYVVHTMLHGAMRRRQRPMEGIQRMDQERIRKPLEKLQNELASAVAEEHHETLARLQAETQSLLERADRPPSAEHRSFRERLGEALPDFEASHPRLTAAMNEVIDALNRMGL